MNNQTPDPKPADAEQPTDEGLDETTCSPSYYTFRNKDGQTIQLRGDLTMEELVRMGYDDIRLVQPETPLRPNEWRVDPISENSQAQPPQVG
jgi:hypothetical protein